MDLDPSPSGGHIVGPPRRLGKHQANLQLKEADVFLMLINRCSGQHGLNHFVDVLIRFVVLDIFALEVEADIACALMPQFQGVQVFLLKSAEYQQCLVGLLYEGRVVPHVGWRYVNAL